MMSTLQKRDTPKGWELKKLNDYIEEGAIELSRGNVISKKDIAAHPGPNPIYSSSIQNGGLFGTYGDYMFDEELITWSVDGGGDFFYRPKHKFSVTNVSGILKADTKKFNYQFLAYLLEWEHRKLHFDYQTKAHPSVIRELYFISRPPINEQKKIAEILGMVDEEIQKTDEIITATEKLKRGLMQQLFTRGIGHTKFKKTELGEIPTEWKLSKLRDVSTFTNGKAHEKDINESGKYIVVNSKFISSDGLVMKRSDKNLSPLKNGDITMVMSDIPKGKALAKCFFIGENDKYTLNQRICAIRTTAMNNKFLYYILNRNRYFLAFDNGVGQTNLRKDEVLDCPIQVPNKDEQRAIVELLSSVDEKISVNHKLKARLILLKKGLMQDLLSGKKRTI